MRDSDRKPYRTNNVVFDVLTCTPLRWNVSRLDTFEYSDIQRIKSISDFGTAQGVIRPPRCPTSPNGTAGKPWARPGSFSTCWWNALVSWSPGN